MQTSRRDILKMSADPLKINKITGMNKRKHQTIITVHSLLLVFTSLSIPGADGEGKHTLWGRFACDTQLVGVYLEAAITPAFFIP